LKGIVAGAAGFLGSHLCESLIERGDKVIGLDDLSTGDLRNLSHLQGSPLFEFHKIDISQIKQKFEDIDYILNFASPASPPRYLEMPVHTLRTGSFGTAKLLDLAKENNARFIMASTSEVYGDPKVNPQYESYWGNVNPVGPRSCYDEAKRFSESLAYGYKTEYGLDIGIMRIFNTYGPRLGIYDGRVVSNFILSALRNEPIEIYGTGNQTRSLCYVGDLIQGILKFLDSNESGPMNIGNPNEISVLDLGKLIIELTSSSSDVLFKPPMTDDPQVRCPNISLISQRLNWRPTTNLIDGLNKTISWARSVLDEN
jgi:nucleoside-diphosphate-sugar epimerase